MDAKVKEQANGNRGTYKLTDNFFRFWYAFGFANFSQLEDGDVDGVYEYIVEPALHEFASSAFEDVCREFVREKQKKNELPFRYSRMDGGGEKPQSEIKTQKTDSEPEKRKLICLLSTGEQKSILSESANSRKSRLTMPNISIRWLN